MKKRSLELMELKTQKCHFVILSIIWRWFLFHTHKFLDSYKKFHTLKLKLDITLHCKGFFTDNTSEKPFMGTTEARPKFEPYTTAVEEDPKSDGMTKIFLCFQTSQIFLKNLYEPTIFAPL